MQTTAIPTINVSTPSQTKDASNIASTGTQSPTFQKVLNKEIQKENSGIKKAELAQQNKTSKENKATPASEPNPTTTTTTITSAPTSKSEKIDTKIEDETKQTESPTDILSYVQDLNQLFNGLAAAPTTSQVKLNGNAGSTELPASTTNTTTEVKSAGLASNENGGLLKDLRTLSTEDKNNKIDTTNKQLSDVQDFAHIANAVNAAASFKSGDNKLTDQSNSTDAVATTLISAGVPINTSDSIASTTPFALDPASSVAMHLANNDLNTANLNSKPTATDKTALDFNPTEKLIATTQAKEMNTINSPAAVFSLSKQETSSSGEVSNKELSIKDSVTNTPPQIAATTNAADLRTIAAAPVPSHIPQAIHSQEWNQALGNKIIWMAQDGIQTAQLDLNPPDLGPLQIVLNISNENIDARFVSSHMEVRTAVEAAMPKLKEMMENNGLSLSGFNVSSQGSPQEQFQQQQEARNRLNQLDGTRLDKNATTTAQEIIVNRPKLQSSLGQVDTFV